MPFKNPNKTYTEDFNLKRFAKDKAFYEMAYQGATYGSSKKYFNNYITIQVQLNEIDNHLLTKIDKHNLAIVYTNAFLNEYNGNNKNDIIFTFLWK